jgi:beta-glucosidase
MKDRTYRYLGGEPQYPFGYGLTYADVEVKEARLEWEDAEGEFDAVPQAAYMNVMYENHSSVPTRDVIQVYVDAEESPFRTPNPRLCGFLKVDAPAGQRVQCKVRLDRDTFRVVNEKGEYVPGGGRYRFYVGTCAPGRRSFALTGKTPVEVCTAVGPDF